MMIVVTAMRSKVVLVVTVVTVVTVMVPVVTVMVPVVMMNMVSDCNTDGDDSGR